MLRTPLFSNSLIFFAFFFGTNGIAALTLFQKKSRAGEFRSVKLEGRPTRRRMRARASTAACQACLPVKPVKHTSHPRQKPWLQPALLDLAFPLSASAHPHLERIRSPRCGVANTQWRTPYETPRWGQSWTQPAHTRKIVPLAHLPRVRICISKASLPEGISIGVHELVKHHIRSDVLHLHSSSESYRLTEYYRRSHRLGQITLPLLLQRGTGTFASWTLAMRAQSRIASRGDARRPPILLLPYQKPSRWSCSKTSKSIPPSPSPSPILLLHLILPSEL